MTRAGAIALTAALVFSAAGARAEPIAVHHRISVHLDPAAGTIEATDHIHLSTRQAKGFALAKGLRLEHLIVDGTTAAVDPEAGEWSLKLSKGAEHEVTVQYGGSLAEMPPAGGILLVSPAGTFLAGDGWYPSFDAGLLSYDLTAEVPSGQIAVAPGKLLSESTDAKHYTARFASEGPVDQIALFAGPYRMSEQRHRGWRLRTYFDPDVANLSAEYLKKTAGYIDLYNGWIGAYPYSGFDVVSGQQPFGLGFPGLTYIGAVVLRLPFIPDTSLGHEVLHDWWGNAVLVDVRRGNWAEGLTTFMADYTYAERKSAEAARDMRRRWMRMYAALPPRREQPLTAFRSRHHTSSQVIGYSKAAMVFLMLRDELGADEFTAGIRRFWKQNRFKVASWDDLRRAFEATSGRPLSDFFSQWVDRTGSPVLALHDAAVHKDGGSFVLSFTLSQQPPAYHLRVPVAIDGGVVTKAVQLDTPSRHYDIRLAHAPSRICVDPSFRLFRRPLPGEVAPILRSVVFDPSAPAVIAASEPQAHAAAAELAAQLLEREPRFAGATAPLPEGPVAVIGTEAEVGNLLAKNGLAAPAPLAKRGTARAWAMQRSGKGTLVVIAARDAAALRAVTGPLPHYGSESFIVFDGRRAVDRGVWPPTAQPLCAALSHSPSS